jgi:site-specific recombinase XerD
MEMTLAEAIHLYQTHLKAQGKHERTLYTYGRDLQQVCAFFGAEKSLGTITLPLVGKFLKSDTLLQLSNGRERAPQTVGKTIRVFRQFLIWAHTEGHLAHLPLTKEIPLGRNTVSCSG